MSKKYIQPVRGTHDLIGDDMRRFRVICDSARAVSALFGFKEMQTPMFEFSEVFHRSLGDTSDVVSKETYTFEDRGGESLTLRPEFTAAIVRAFISNGYTQQLPFKAFYSGPAFRYERPQKGRQRQFHQVGVECLGADNPGHDIETIACADIFLRGFFDTEFNDNHLTLEINTLGDEVSRVNYREALVTYLQKYKDDLSEESRIRLEKNPLRILDSKQAEDKRIVADAPLFEQYLGAESRLWYDTVTQALDKLDIAFTESPRLVRGLDYYSHTVFEFTTDRLGAQSTVLAGGRYNNLVAHMGGGNISGIGWAAGVERLMQLADMQLTNDAKKRQSSLLILAVTNSDYLKYLYPIAMQMRMHNIRTEICYKTNISKAGKYANDLHANFFAVLGENELEQGNLLIKDLQTGNAVNISLAALNTTLIANNQHLQPKTIEASIDFFRTLTPNTSFT